MGTFAWTRYVRGETVVDFGCRYLCVDAAVTRASVRYSDEIPREAVWIARLSDIVATIPLEPIAASAGEARSAETAGLGPQGEHATREAGDAHE